MTGGGEGSASGGGNSCGLTRPAPPDADADDDEVLYNPLKLPLGWDGKPIPFWLYKLHGLNQEFKCEICGNVSRRAAEPPPARPPARPRASAD